jgi:isoprenylcysteine carboxyl methyltransferase (ICMT) family protein YpbQ
MTYSINRSNEYKHYLHGNTGKKIALLTILIGLFNKSKMTRFIYSLNLAMLEQRYQG